MYSRPLCLFVRACSVAGDIGVEGADQSSSFAVSNCSPSSRLSCGLTASGGTAGVVLVAAAAPTFLPSAASVPGRLAVERRGMRLLRLRSCASQRRQATMKTLRFRTYTNTTGNINSGTAGLVADHKKRKQTTQHKTQTHRTSYLQPTPKTASK